MFFVPADSALYPIIWKVKAAWGPRENPSPISQLDEASEIYEDVFFCISNHGTFFAAYQACKGQKIILFRSTPQSSWYSWWLCQENVYFSTCQEETQEKKVLAEYGAPRPWKGESCPGLACAHNPAPQRGNYLLGAQQTVHNYTLRRITALYE